MKKIKLMSEWKEYKLSEVFDFASGLSKSRDQFGFGFDFLSYMNIFDNYFIPKRLDSSVNSTEKERYSCSIKRGDVFLTRTSETDEELGISSVALIDYPNATFNGFTKRLRPKGNVEILPEYAGFYFRSPRFRAMVGGMSSITTRASLNNSMLSELIIILPPIKIQIAIAKTLKTLHDKIDLLHRQNETLEQLAETLFRQWFLENFGQLSPLGKLAKISTGRGIKRNEFIENGLYPILGANGEIGRTDNFLTDEKLILTGRVGTLGEVKISDGKVWISDNVLIIKSNDDKYFYPIYFTLKKYDFENLNAGSTQPLVTQTDLKTIDISICNEKMREEYEEHCNNYFKKIKANTNQIKTLTSLRDTLLSKLMSGEVRIEMD